MMGNQLSEIHQKNGFLKGGDVDDVGDIPVDTIQEYCLKSTHLPVAS